MIRGNFMRFGNFKFFYLFLLFSISNFSQNLEDKIYNAIDTFVNNPTKHSLEELTLKEKEFSNLVSTKDEQLALVILYCNKGSFEMKNNIQKKAITSYENAWNLFSKNNLDNYDIIEYCLKPLGTLYTKTGNFTLAENIIKKYIFIAEKENNQPTIISGYINLSIVYKTIGNHKTAIDLLQKVEKNNQTSTLQKKRIQEELTLNKIGLQKKDSSNPLEKDVVNYDSNTSKTNAFLALQNKNPDLAITYLEKAKFDLVKNKAFEARELAKLYVDEATIYITTQEYEKARNSYSKALQTLLPFEKNWMNPKTTSLSAENTFLDIFDGFAYLEDNTFKKLNWYNLSFYVSQLISEHLVTQEAQIIQQVSDRKRTERYIDALWNEYQKNNKFSLLQKAFQYAEKSKNTVLKERNNQKTLLEQFPNNKNLQLQNKLLTKQETLINEYIRLQITQENETRMVTLNNELASLSITLKNTNEKVNSQFKKTNNDTLAWKTLEQKLKKDKTQLVYYFWAKETCYSFYFNNNQITWKKIDFDKKNTALLQQYIHYFDDANAINKNVVAFSSVAYQLYQLLELNTLEKDKNLVIIPDGLLHFVAFDALVTQKSTAKIYTKIPFLVYQNKIAYQTNATFYCKEVTLKKNDKIVGFFPVFKNTNAYLEYSIEEAKTLEKNKATLFINEEANRKNFKQNTSQYSIIHLSTHGTSGSFSTPATLVFYDDVMLVNELYGLKNCNPDLVILSACETGIGKLQKGEGAISIARAFQYAGAKNVLFSLWKINDYATSEIMTNFYDNYTSTHSFFESNYHSKLNYLKNKTISNPKKSPYYWSAFVYYGAIDTTETHYFYYYLFAFFSIIILFLIYGRIARFLKRKKI